MANIHDINNRRAKMALTPEDHDIGVKLYREAEDRGNAAQDKYDELRRWLYGRLTAPDVNLVAHELDAILTPLAEANNLVAKAQQQVWSSHRAAAIRAYKSRIMPHQQLALARMQTSTQSYEEALADVEAQMKSGELKLDSGGGPKTGGCD